MIDLIFGSIVIVVMFPMAMVNAITVYQDKTCVTLLAFLYSFSAGLILLCGVVFLIEGHAP